MKNRFHKYNKNLFRNTPFFTFFPIFRVNKSVTNINKNVSRIVNQ